MNELVFFLHIMWVSLSAVVARRVSYAASACLMVLYSVLGNLMVLKQMELYSLTVTTADVYAVGVILVLNFIREDFDDKHVHRAMCYSFASLSMLALAAYTQLSYVAVPHDAFDASYQQIMNFMPSLVMKSACVYLVVQYLDNRVFAWMKSVMSGGYLIFRMVLSLVFSQVLDTVLFSIWALGDIAVSIWEIILFSSLIKVGCSLVMVAYTFVYERSSRVFGK